MSLDLLLNILMPVDIIKLTATRLKAIRKRKKITQQELSSKSGVSLSSLKRFEHTGDISYLSLVKLACALEVEDELKNLFQEVPYNSIEEILNEKKNT